MAPALVTDLGGYLREQRMAARLSLRQLSDLAGISNPYLSQIERGLKKPSAEILQQIAHGLQMSAESLYIKAGILEEGSERRPTPGVLDAIAADPHLTPKQRGVLTEVYRAFVSQSPKSADEAQPSRSTPEPTSTAHQRDSLVRAAGAFR
ncbi:MAG: helix-turn-helix domain-containing protein [Dermatophilaceae bacterium]